MIDELVLFCQHHNAVQSEKTAEFRGIKHPDGLIIAFFKVQLTGHLDGKTHIGRMIFAVPKIVHLILLSAH